MRSHLLHLRIGALAAYAAEQRSLTLLIVLPLGLLLLAVHTLFGQLAVHEIALAATALDAGVFEGRGSQGNMLAAAQEQLQHLCVEQTLHSLTIDMGNEIRRSQSCLKSRAALVYGHDQMVHRIKVRVAIVHPDGVYSKTKSTRSTSNDDRWLQICDQWRELSARRRIPGAGCAGAIASAARRLNAAQLSGQLTVVQ